MAPLNVIAASSTPSSMDENDKSSEIVVMVTPYSTGCCIAKEIKDRGYNLMCLWNRGFAEEMKKHVPSSCADLSYFAEITEGETMEHTIAALEKAAASGGYKIVGVVCGGEAGVDLADALSEAMGMITNGTEIPNRRDKKVQQELIKARGLRSIRQAAGSNFDQVEDFLRSEKCPVVVKPVDSAGSDGVKLCHSFQEAKEHFHHLLSTQMVNGGTCHEALCQEYLRGKEYVVDHVSSNGEHKTVMCWVYDKRPANGAQFVYHGVIPVHSESAEAKAMIPYVRDVLRALGVSNGPSHGEVIMTEDGPCLVEMNCRAHGGDGNWQGLCKELCGGYNQVTATVDSYLDLDKFHELPNKMPSPFLAAGEEVDLVSFFAGTVVSTPGFDKIRQLESFVLMASHVLPGTKVEKTIDLVTDIGNIILMHSDRKILEGDVEFIRSVEKIPGALFEIEVDSGDEEEDEDAVFPTLTRTLSAPKSHRYYNFNQPVEQRRHFRHHSDVSDFIFPAMIKTMSECKNHRVMPRIDSQVSFTHDQDHA